MSTVDLIEEGYLRSLVSDVIKSHEENARALRDLQGRIERYSQDLSRILELADSAKHYIGAPVISRHVSQLKDVVKELLSSITELKTEDPGAIRAFIEDSSNKMDRVSQILKAIEESLKRPLHSYIVAKCSEYLGLDSEKVRELLEKLSDEEVLKMKSKISDLVVQIDGQYSNLKEHIKKVFSLHTVQRNLNSDNLKRLPDYALYTCEVLSKCEEGGMYGINIIVHLLSRVNDYNAFSQVRRYNHIFSDRVKGLMQNLSKLSKLLDVNGEALYRRLLELINSEVFARLKDVREKLDSICEAAGHVIRVKEARQELKGLLEEATTRYEEVKDELSEYFKRNYERYIKVLKELDECYAKGIPEDIDSIVKCIYYGRCAEECPEDITIEIFNRVKDSVDRVIKVLESDRVIAEKLCQGTGIDRRVDELYNKVRSVYSRHTDVLHYHNYIVKANEVSKDIVECIKAGGTKEEVEIPITELDIEVIKALIEVLRSRNMQLVLKAS